MLPVRIVAVCDAGHIQDFPFREWIKCKCPDEAVSQLFFKAGRSAASLAGIWIHCATCGQRQSLAQAFNDDVLARLNIHCLGGQPWLGREAGEVACPEPLKTLQRGASNVYFPVVASSIYIPGESASESEEISSLLDNAAYWDMLASGVVDGEPDRHITQRIAVKKDIDPDMLHRAVAARLGRAAGAITPSTTDEEFRKQEYDVLAGVGGDLHRDLLVEAVPGERYGGFGGVFKMVGLVRKLRETRVLTGFSRLHPRVDWNDPGVQRLSISRDLRWLPAIDTRGEGIFVQLRENRLQEWAARASGSERIGRLIRKVNADRRDLGRPRMRPIDCLRFMMIHTLAHVTIRELIFTCGYGSSSLRERIYCNVENHDHEMNGFLIYTASGDSEGSLGGLVAMGEPQAFEPTLQAALRRAGWCSNDPICMESADGGEVSQNLAACHGCVMLPETSCELGNHQLDRALLVGTMDDPILGFFDGIV